MKLQLNKTVATTGILSLILGFALGWIIMGSTPPSVSVQNEHDHLESTTEQWTCSMHPQIRQSEAGKCPICGMSLIPVDQMESEDPTVLKMSPNAVRLANIQTTKITSRGIGKILRLDGKVMIDERRVYSQTAHFPGRIEKLYVNYTGEEIRKEQNIASVYSPELITAQKELFEAKKYASPNDAIVVAARNKLKQWKLSDRQIEDIERNGEIISEFDIIADEKGVITTKMINKGDHINTGTPLYEVSDLSRLWVVFDAYEKDLQWIKIGNTIEFRVSSLPDRSFKSKVTFIDPSIDPRTRVTRIRTEIANPIRSLKPEMFVSGKVNVKLQSSEDQITVAKSAVMWTGKRSVVYVKLQNTDYPSFQFREVDLGAELDDSYIITAGLNVGEEVVTHGTFSVDAAAQLQGKPSMMNPDGGVVHSGHDHQIPGLETVSAPLVPEKDYFSVTELPSLISFSDQTDQKFKEQLTTLLMSYFKLKDDLVNSDNTKLTSAINNVIKDVEKVNMGLLKGEVHLRWMDYLKVINSSLTDMQTNNQLSQRRLYFINFSNALIASVKSFGISTNEIVYIQHCPMANNDKGADWLSLNKNILNPYFGEQMLTCGWISNEISN